MTDKSSKDPRDEPGAEERFERGLKNALATPPKLHKDQPPKKTGAKLSERR